MIQTKQNIFLYFLTALFIPFFSCSDGGQETRFISSVSADDASVLRVAVSPDLPGCFQFNGQQMGYAYDLLDAYAQSFNQTLEIVPADADTLTDGRIDLTTVLCSSASGADRTLIPLYETSYVVLATSRKMDRLSGMTDIYDLLDGHNILFSRGFSTTRAYDLLHDQLPGANLVASAKGTFELIEELINNRFDFLVCERSEAQLGCSLIHNIRKIHEFDETVSVCAVPTAAAPEGGRRLTAWLYNFQQSEASTDLYALYFDKGITQRIISGGVKNRPAGAISVYDDLFKQVAQEEKLDWRLVSAIAYSESKYNAYLVSPRGARGLMQVMPATARAFDVPVDELMDPEANVRVAVQLIRRIEKSLRFSAEVSANDRTCIVLACYNAGIGHVTDARRLAAKHGANPDSWDDVSHYLRLKSQPEYAEDESVRCGGFNGAGETLNFVNHVMGKYYAYCGKKQ